MDTLATELVRLLRAWGPLLLTLLAFLETSFITGLVVPAGVALLVASFLSTQGLMDLPVVVGAACAGAWLGDSTGFWVGRRAGRRILAHGGVGDRALAGRRVRLRRLLQAPPFVSITLARVVAFVRTLMPLGAGMGTVGYARFLLWDAIGIVLWAASYVAVGVVAGESWQRVSRWVGAGWIVIFAVAVAGVVVRRRRRRDPDRLHSVALTGNAGSGKSTVAAVWRAAGVPVVDADALARDAVAPGSDGLGEVVAAFGNEVLAGDGTLDRAALRTRVFADPAARRRLEGILHPRIADLRTAWIDRQRAQGASLVISEIPLLFETGLDAGFETVVSVHVPRDTLRRRLTAERGLSAAEADRVLGAQVPTADTLHLADHVIHNTGSRKDLEDAARRMLDALREESG